MKTCELSGGSGGPMYGKSSSVALSIGEILTSELKPEEGKWVSDKYRSETSKEKEQDIVKVAMDVRGRVE